MSITGELTGRVAIVTGAGRGLGRSYALALAASGADVVVNDLGVDRTGNLPDHSAADQVVAEIVAAGGSAVANHDDVSNWEGGQRMIATAIAQFGDLHIVVNNAGILRDRRLVNMTEQDWDGVITTHLKGHFVPTRWAAQHWRDEYRAGRFARRSLINTSSTSGLMANPGQANYGTAKSGIATFSQICAKELEEFGVATNCVVPAARTRLTESAPGLGDMVQPPVESALFDVWHPDNVAPVVCYLASDQCSFNGATFFVQGGKVSFMRGWQMGTALERDQRWTVEELREQLDRRSR
jgi:NAD(P)-dependent dehydrogenase (short-subunit alcohol dehydrogenase family)